jgi:multiple sugar transport system ATP-binding protein
MASVRLEGVHKVYPNGHCALRAFDLRVNDGELVVLVGPSGSGKSTALRIVAGLEAPSSGRAYVGEHDVTDWAPRERDVAMVFQSYALYPHKSVRENLAFGLRMRGVAAAEIARRTTDVAERLALSTLLERKPAQLSGGQRQRVALGRALIRQPQVFLLDEPLSNLDAKLRAEMRAELARLHAAFGVTTLHVTHDQEEAMTLGDRVAVLGEGGRLEQFASPIEVYREPSNAFVAEFIGTPRINWWQGAVQDGAFVCADFRLELPGAREPRSHAAVKLGVRPADLTVGDPAQAPIRGQVELIETFGATALLHARTASAATVRVVVQAETQVRRGDTIGVVPVPGRAHAFDAASGARLWPAA